MATSHTPKPGAAVFMNEAEINLALVEMEQDILLSTEPVLVKYADNSARLVAFREIHADYLKKHPKVNPEHYLANLHAMVKIRT